MKPIPRVTSYGLAATKAAALAASLGHYADARRHLRVMHHVIFGEQLAGQIVLTLVAHLLEVAPNHGLVLCGHRLTPLPWFV